MARVRGHQSLACPGPRAPRNGDACFYIGGDNSRPCIGTQVHRRKPQAAYLDVSSLTALAGVGYRSVRIHIRQLQPVRRGLIELVSETLGEVGRFEKGMLVGSE